MKTVLVPTENDDAMRSALETALQLARRCNSYIEGFALRWDVSELVGGDVMSGVWLDTFRHDLPNEEKQAREIFETMLAARNHVGLLSEDTHPTTGEMWGNFPQTYSMVGIINAAVRLSAPWDSQI